MKLVVLGGGGFRVPLVHGALLRDSAAPRVREVVLVDPDPRRLAAMQAVLAGQAAQAAQAGGAGERLEPPAVSATTDLDEALPGADFVFSAIRVGGLHGRTVDERAALDVGLLGQETTGAGGVSYGLRTVPVALDVAQRVARAAPDAWLINFTNPAGMVTQAMQSVLGERAVGICDSPLGLARRAARALGRDLAELDVDYAGINHLGWLAGLRERDGGRDLLPGLLADPALLASIEEGELFGADWLQSTGTLPNEYVWYYDFTREAVGTVLAAPQTRGEYLRAQQDGFYDEVAAAPPGQAFTVWQQVRRQRDATYMQEARAEATSERAQADVDGGGYEGVALALMAAIARDEPARLILNVRNGATLPGLPADAVVEVPCQVDSAGPRPLPVSPLTGARLGLVQQVKAVDELVLRAAQDGSASLALQALALHPLVDSVNLARRVLATHRAALPALYAHLH